MSTIPQPPPSNPTKYITVYLTGFAPWSTITSNPSSEISLSFLPAGSAVIKFTGPNGINYNISLHPHPKPIRVCYKDVDKIVDKLWEEGKFDYVLHIGLGLNVGYRLETRAHVEGYRWGDVDGLDASGKEGLRRKPTDQSEGDGSEELTHPEGREGEKDKVYMTGLDVGYLWRFVEKNAKKVDGRTVKISESQQAGRFLCEYIFRCSLKQAEKRDNGPSKRVLFMHVPEKGMPYSIETGADVVKTLVEGMVRDGEGLRLHEDQGYIGL